MSRYRRFIKSRKNRIIPVGVPVESHHKLPRSLGGTNYKDNLINLTYREHYIAHFLLWKEYGGKMAQAFFLMTHIGKYDSRLTSRQYEQLKIEYAKIISVQHTGKKMSEEAKQKMSEAQKGKVSVNRAGEIRHVSPDEAAFLLEDGWKLGSNVAPMKGKHHSDEARKKQSEAAKLNGNKHLTDWIEEHGAHNKGKKASEEARRNQSEAHKGIKMPASHGGNTAKARIGKTWVTNGTENKVIEPADLVEWESKGWLQGKVAKKPSKRYRKKQLELYAKLGMLPPTDY